MNAISNRNFNLIGWSTTVILTLSFWLSGILILDLVIIPSLSSAGMMTQSAFASAGYILFGIFNHIEVLCAALILTGFLSFSHLTHKTKSWSIFLAIVLLIIALTDTYGLTPQMSGLGLSLNIFEVQPIMSNMMLTLHQTYWGLEIIKFLGAIVLLSQCYQQDKTA